MVVSASLDGDIRIWNTNPMKRQCVTTISRRSDPPQKACPSVNTPLLDYMLQFGHFSLCSKVCGDYVEGPSSKLPRARPAAEGCEDTAETWSNNGVTAATTKPLPLVTPSVPLSVSGASQTSVHRQSQTSLPEVPLPPPLSTVSTSFQQGVSKSVSLQEIPIYTPPLSPSLHLPQPPPPVPPAYRTHRRIPSLPATLHSIVPAVSSHQTLFHTPNHFVPSSREVTPPIGHTHGNSADVQVRDWRNGRRHSVVTNEHLARMEPSLPSSSPFVWTPIVTTSPAASCAVSTHSTLSPPPPRSQPLAPAQPVSLDQQPAISTNPPFFPPSSHDSSAHAPPQRASHFRNKSLGSIPRRSHSRSSSHGSILMRSTSETTRTLSDLEALPPPPPPLPPVSLAGSTSTAADPAPEANGGYNFSRHFNLFSPFTSDLALEFCGELSEETPEIAAPPIWCMDVWSNTIAVGCGNGQIEVGVAW